MRNNEFPEFKLSAIWPDSANALLLIWAAIGTVSVTSLLTLTTDGVLCCAEVSVLTKRVGFNQI